MVPDLEHFDFTYMNRINKQRSYVVVGEGRDSKYIPVSLAHQIQEERICNCCGELKVNLWECKTCGGLNCVLGPCCICAR